MNGLSKTSGARTSICSSPSMISVIRSLGNEEFMQKERVFYKDLNENGKIFANFI